MKFRSGTASTKVEAVQMAITAGFDSRQIGSGYIKSQFGLDVSPQHFSSTKSQLKSKVLEGKPGRKPKRVEGYLSPPPKQRGQVEIRKCCSWRWKP